MTTRRRLKADEFKAATERLTISARSEQMARRVLVEGDLQATVANEYGVTVGAVSHQIRRIWQAHCEMQEVPPGHERITAVIPTEKAEIVRTWERESRRKQ